MNDKKDMDLKNDLAKKAYQSSQNKSELEPEIVESNLTYLLYLIFNAALFLLYPSIYGKLSIDLLIGISAICLVVSIPFMILGIKLIKKSKSFKFLFYIDFILLSVSVFLSVVAILAYYKIDISMNSSLILVAILAILAAIDFLVLSLGVKERLFFALLSLMFIFVFILAFFTAKLSFLNGLKLPLIIYSLVFLVIHLTMLLYVVSGENFFTLMSLNYLIIAIVVLIIALMIVTESDSCSCDCVDTPSLKEGGRRAKLKKPEIIPTEIDPIIRYN